MNQYEFKRPANRVKFHKGPIIKKMALHNVSIDTKIHSPNIVPPKGVLSGDLVEALWVTFWITVEIEKGKSVMRKK